MFKPTRVMKIIDGLQAADALMLVVWDAHKINPRIYLKEWCGPYKHSISIGTAESVLDDIRMGLRKKPRPIAITTRMRRLAIETAFVGGAVTWQRDSTQSISCRK